MVKNTLNVGSITEGFVLDHIEAGKDMSIYKYLKLDKMDCCVAIIKNAHSNKMGKKDIIKVEGDASWLNLDVLAYLDPDISVTVIENGKAVRKEKPKPPQASGEHCAVPQSPAASPPLKRNVTRSLR